MVSRFYLIAEVRDDNHEWQIVPYMRDKSVMQSFRNFEDAVETARSLQKLLSNAGNPCIVKILEQHAQINNNNSEITFDLQYR